MRAFRHAFRAILPVAAALLLTACEQAAQNEAAPAAPPPAVTVVTIGEQDMVQSVAFTGRVEAVDKVEVRARVDGFLEQRLFGEGKDVKKGDLLFVIEKAPYEAAVAEAEGALESAKAALARANVEFDRQQSLAKSNVSAQARLDDAVAARDQAKGNLAQLEAKLERARLELGYTNIVSPIDGRIGKSEFSIGSLVGPGSGPLATIVSQDPIYVTFSVTQREILAVCREEARGVCRGEAVVKVQLADGSFYPANGQISFVDVVVNQGTDAVGIRATFPNPKQALVDGQLVTAVVQSENPELALMIPQTAIQVDQIGTFALVVNAENKIEVKRIELGPASGTNYVVSKGLAAGDRVVTEGVQKVRPGQQVQASEAVSGT
jgi:membrane fusion protein (multidrug efflux system)